jgi:2-methylcitrate dehydratase PrpD
MSNPGPVGWIHALRFEHLPPHVVEQAKRCLLDLIGVAAAGARTPLARIVTTFAAAQFGAPGGPRMMLDGRRASPVGAAFAGASMIDSFDAHDGHSLVKGHAGVAVLPALLALADGTAKPDGPELLTCLVIGYEIAIRAGIALHASADDYHTSGAWNALGCAAIGARLLRLTPAQTREALGIAEFHGPRSQMMRCIADPTMVKDGSGWGAMAGVSAAFLAQAGFTGAPAVTVEEDRHAATWADLGARWRIMEQYFKPHPVCRWAHPAMEAARKAMLENRVAPQDIERIEVRTFAEAAALSVWAPGSTEQAQYSLPFPLAALLVRGRVGADEIMRSGLADPTILHLARRVTLVSDPELSGRFPAERLAAVSLTLTNGATLRTAPTAAQGDPARPLSDAELAAKFDALAGAMQPARRARIRHEVGALDAARDVALLLDAVLSKGDDDG